MSQLKLTMIYKIVHIVARALILVGGKQRREVKMAFINSLPTRTVT